MKISRTASQLLVIDIQERLAPVMAAGAPAVDLTQKLLRFASRLGIPATLTEQYRKGIGPTLPGVLEAAGTGAAVFEKMTFSALGEPAIAEHLRAAGRDQVVIAGIESHVCVLQTALDLQAEGLKQAQVLEAEGRREAAFRDAEARERSAEAEAKATQMVSDAIASGNVQAINYFVANNYIKALEGLAKSPNQKVLMLPVEAASVIGAIGGIAEIAKETFGGTPPTTPRSGRPPSTGQ